MDWPGTWRRAKAQPLGALPTRGWAWLYCAEADPRTDKGLVHKVLANCGDPWQEPATIRSLSLFQDCYHWGHSCDELRRLCHDLAEDLQGSEPAGYQMGRLKDFFMRVDPAQGWVMTRNWARCLIGLRPEPLTQEDMQMTDKWRPFDIEVAKALRSRGYSTDDIAMAVQRSRSSVNCRMSRMAKNKEGVPKGKLRKGAPRVTGPIQDRRVLQAFLAGDEPPALPASANAKPKRTKEPREPRKLNGRSPRMRWTEWQTEILKDMISVGFPRGVIDKALGLGFRSAQQRSVRLGINSRKFDTTLPTPDCVFQSCDDWLSWAFANLSEEQLGRIPGKRLTRRPAADVAPEAAPAPAPEPVPEPRPQVVQTPQPADTTSRIVQVWRTISRDYRRRLRQDGNPAQVASLNEMEDLIYALEDAEP